MRATPEQLPFRNQEIESKPTPNGLNTNEHAGVSCTMQVIQSVLPLRRAFDPCLKCPMPE
jgi:hypothetical protein